MVVSPGFPYFDDRVERITISLRSSNLKKLDQVIRTDPRFCNRSQAIEWIIQSVLNKEKDLLKSRAREIVRELNTLQLRIRDLQDKEMLEDPLEVK